MDPDLYDWTSLNTTLDYDYQSPDNETSNDDNSWEDITSMFQKISITLFSLIFVLGIIGNGLVIWIAGFRMKKTISAAWFLSLAIADFLCCTSIPLQIARWADVFKFPSNTLCLSTAILFTINMSASIFLLTAMSIDRCVSVMWPLWAQIHRTRRLVRITVGVIWVCSFHLICLILFIERLYHGRISEWCRLYSLLNYTTSRNYLVQIFRLLMMFVIPFLIIVTSYVIIFLKLRRSKRPQRSQRPYRIITAVILCFFICWSPYYILPITFPFNVGYIEYHSVFTIITILAYLNSCLNPILYVFMGQNIKPYFFRSIPARVERALSDYPEEPNREPEDGENICNTDV
ncbi:chemerin-like receptor 1 [Leptodactylus fuscus]|uniref:chemerin-like receptor 1 n=1 Tax=Leptodactylus fuscus TaxID=238119 RepID=UPI003F4EB6B5